MLVTKTVKTVTNILKFSATHSSPTFVTNIDVAILKLFQTSILSALKRWRNGCLFSWMAQLHPRWNGYQQPTSSNTHQYIEIWPARPRDCPFTVMIDDWKITIFAIYLYTYVYNVYNTKVINIDNWKWKTLFIYEVQFSKLEFTQLSSKTIWFWFNFNIN